MDREVWLMLLGYLLDARSTSAIAKSVSGFAQLKYVHESAVMSRIMIKVSMHDTKLVPPFITVGVGDGVKIRTWTILVYILSATCVTTLGDEDGYPPEGPMHPVPPQPPWLGPHKDCPHVAESRMDDNTSPTLMQ
jgi:hypothetical protein